MEVLASRVLLRPADLERSRAFYRDVLKLPIFREFATPGGTGIVFFIGGGYLEVSGRSDASYGPGIELWLQVRDVAAARRELEGVPVLREPRREPWGLIEMWIEDPDGVRICVVEVPPDHHLRSATGTRAAEPSS
jgi:catechol 2,3-dioxygenase-like lactoylglutathione lyase family enzyme